MRSGFSLQKQPLLRSHAPGQETVLQCLLLPPGSRQLESCRGQAVYVYVEYVYVYVATLLALIIWLSIVRTIGIL